MQAQQQQRRDTSHSWADVASRFAIDALLRRYGFEIAQRNGREAIWYKRYRDAQGRPTRLEPGPTGKPRTYTQRQALAGVPQMEVEQAAGKQRGYLEGKYA